MLWAARLGLPRRRLKRLFYALLELVRHEAVLYGRLARRGLMPVLNLHRVSPVPNPFWPPLDPRDFAALLGFLAARFDVVRLGDLADGVRARTGRRRPAVVLSFDDGYYDFVEHALPLLRKHRMPANQNVIGSCVVSGVPVWNVLLSDFLSQAPRSLIDELRLPGFGLRLRGDDVDSKLGFGLALSAFLKRKTRHERALLWPSVTSLMARHDFTPTRMMTVEEIRQVAGDCDVGCHSFSHESMGGESEPFFEDDFAQCRTLFAASLGLPLRIYAFPNGSYRPEQISFLAREPGLGHILLVDEKLMAGAVAAAGGARVWTRLTMSAQSSAEARLLALGYRARGVFAAVAR